MKSINSALCVMLLVVAASACGQAQTDAATPAELDRKIPRLPTGASISFVEERIGTPLDQAELEDGKISVLYSQWQLVFDPGLIVRQRHYKEGRWPPGRSYAPLDREIRRLPLGIAKSAIEKQLGAPEVWEIRKFRRVEALWYGDGRWRLKLVNQRLADRWQTNQVTSGGAVNPVS